ncbi:MAG TPA: hypothetical protein PLI28_10650 [Petrotogaceae bacterium]|nr:MAG: hypothetical protein BWY38_02720 [Ignavibacteria bacterium ADurb.Bin266]HQP59423.1 hypothetical protein [Petrotogaceae bacterium]
MSFVDKMEKRIFFKIVRWFAFIVSFLGFLGIILGVFLFIQNFSNIFPSSKVKVEVSDVQSAIQEKEAADRAKEEAANIEQNNNMAIAALRQAYSIAYSFFRNASEPGVLSLEALKSNGLAMDENIEISVPVGDANGLKITARHKKGNKTYSVDAAGYINEVATETTPAPVKDESSSKKADVKDSKIENLINKAVKQCAGCNPQKFKELLWEITDGINEDYKIQYLEDLNDVLKKAPTDKQPEYFGYFTDIFKQKLIEVTTNKEIKKLTALKDFAVYAGTIFGGILITALFGLILVLLAIERNTRKSEAE